MRNWTARDVIEKLEAKRYKITNKAIAQALADMMNEANGMVKIKADPNKDCVVHWAPGWRL